jgi:proline dehydrogenase
MIARRLAASHLAGPDIEDALRLAEVCSARGWSFVVGPWVAPDNSPRENLSIYVRAIEALAGRNDGYLSLKLSTIGYDEGMFGELLDRGRAAGVRIHCDSIGPESAGPTMALVGKMAASHGNIGATLPAGWRRSAGDAPILAEWGVAIRIVKGQWSDPAGPVPDIRSSYVSLARALAGRPNRIGVATHDRRVARESLSILTAAGTPCDMEQISGLPQNCVSLARSLGVPFRVYIPYGHPYLPYNIWQVRARPAVAMWAIRDFIAGKHRAMR